MNITYIGHAGFMVNCGQENLLMDPWLNPAGAFAASWFPYPPNDNIDPDSLEIADYLYISHWHQDHFDAQFLNSRSEAFKERVVVLISDFTYKKLQEDIARYGYKNIIEITSSNPYITKNAVEIRIIRENNPFFVDSAICIHSDGLTFVNANDCKLSIEEEHRIKQLYGPIDVYAAQFSGATFHPTCYTYDEEKLLKIVRPRRAAKFQRTMDSIERLEARYYIPSAGPACFLADDLRHLNNNERTVFSTNKDFRNYLEKTKPELLLIFFELLPTETIRIAKESVSNIHSQPPTDRYQTNYLSAYAKRKETAIAQELNRYRRPIGNIVSDAKYHFSQLLQLVPELATEANCVLEIIIEDEGKFIVNTVTQIISESTDDDSIQRYQLQLSAFWMRALVDRLISWEDFILSFRFKISRTPDIYNESLIAFLHLETEEERRDYVAYRKAIAAQPPDKVCRWYNGSLIEHNRYCPHNGEDLSNAHIENGILTCPRHFWQFSIENGEGINNDGSIDCRKL